MNELRPRPAPSGAGPRIPRNIIILGFVALASGFGQDLISPALPAYLALIGMSAASIGLIDGLLQGMTNLFRLVSGVLSDRLHNRKGLVFLGYALSSVARPLLAFAGGFAAVAGLRTLDGVGKGTKDAPRDALVADAALAGEHGRAFGFHRLVDTAGSVFGPLTASLLLLSLAPTLSTYRLIFLLAAIPGAIALVLIIFGVRDPEQPAPAKLAPQGRLPLLFWFFAIVTAFATLTRVNDALFLLRATDVGVPKAWVPMVFAGFTLVYAALAYPIGVWTDRLSSRLPVIAGGWAILSLVELGFGEHPKLVAVLGLYLGFGLFYALTEGSGRALVADFAPSALRGRAYAAYYTLTGVAAIAGGWGIGKLWTVMSPTFAFRLSAVGSFIAAVAFGALALRLRKKNVGGIL